MRTHNVTHKGLPCSALFLSRFCAYARRLSKESRAKIITLITIDVHGRDVIQVRTARLNEDDDNKADVV